MSDPPELSEDTKTDVRRLYADHVLKDLVETGRTTELLVMLLSVGISPGAVRAVKTPEQKTKVLDKLWPAFVSFGHVDPDLLKELEEFTGKALAEHNEKEKTDG